MDRLSRATHWLCVVSALAAAPACDDADSAELTHSAESAFDVGEAASGRLTIEAIIGTVDVTGDEAATEVSIRGRRRAKAATDAEAENRLAEVDFEIARTDDELTIRTKHPTGRSDAHYEVDYEITAPSDSHLRIEQVTGAVVVRSWRASVDVSSVTGAVALEDVVGSVDVTLTSGATYASLTLPPTGHANIDIATGAIELAIPVNTSATVTALTGTGLITLRDFDAVDEDPRGNVLQCMLGSGDGSIHLSLGTGDALITGR